MGEEKLGTEGGEVGDGGEELMMEGGEIENEESKFRSLLPLPNLQMVHTLQYPFAPHRTAASQ